MKNKPELFKLVNVQILSSQPSFNGVHHLCHSWWHHVDGFPTNLFNPCQFTCRADAYVVVPQWMH